MDEVGESRGGRAALLFEFVILRSHGEYNRDQSLANAGR